MGGWFTYIGQLGDNILGLVVVFKSMSSTPFAALLDYGFIVVGIAYRGILAFGPEKRRLRRSYGSAGRVADIGRATVRKTHGQVVLDAGSARRPLG